MWAGRIPIGETYVFIWYDVKGKAVVMIGQTGWSIRHAATGFVQGLLFR